MLSPPAPGACSEGRAVPLHCRQRSDVPSCRARAAHRLLCPWLMGSSAPPTHPRKPRAPIEPGLQSQSFPLGCQLLRAGGVTASPMLLGASVGVRCSHATPSTAYPPHQLPLVLEMLLCPSKAATMEQGVAGALGTATNVPKVATRKPGRDHQPESRQLRSTRETDPTAGAAAEL